MGPWDHHCPRGADITFLCMLNVAASLRGALHLMPVTALRALHALLCMLCAAQDGYCSLKNSNAGSAQGGAMLPLVRRVT